MRFGQSKVPFAFYIIILIYLIYSFAFTPNILLTIPLAIFPLVAYKLLWVPKHLNALFWGMIMQWLSVFILPFYCNILGITLLEYFGNSRGAGVFPPLMNTSIYLSITALYFFLFGLYIGIRKLKLNDIDSFILQYSLKSFFRCYIIVSVVINISTIAIWNFPGLVQYIHHLFFIKWGFFVVLFYKIHKEGTKKDRLFLYIIILIEFILGLSTFFASSFLNILFYSLIAIAALQPKLKFKHYLILLLTIALIFHLGVLWTIAKRDYRRFVNGGTKLQTVTVSKEVAISKLFELTQTIDEKRYQKGIVALIMRLGYTYYFSMTLNYVPRVIDHENGKIYGEAISFFLMPRVLFPDKEVLDDSKHLSKYTGQHFNGAEAGSSFSLGYIPDAYIDFGPIFMFIPLFLFGYLFGIFYSYLFRASINTVWVWILTAPFFTLTNIYGTDTKKALGALLIYFFTILILRKIIVSRIDPFIRKKFNMVSSSNQLSPSL